MKKPRVNDLGTNSRRTSSGVTVAASRRSARVARLRYVVDGSVGIHRVRKGRSFEYVTGRGRRIHAPKVLERIRSLAIPPAWNDVWICPRNDGHLQAWGIDARGRKQYRYHPAWRAIRDEEKYGKLADFARALPTIRRRVRRDLKRRGLPREKVLAAVVRLLELTRIRVGNEEYARQNATFGLTTIRNGHARVRGKVVRFDFHGKHGIRHRIEVTNPELATIIRRCSELPGSELFEYLDDAGQVRDVKSSDVNDYLREIAGRAFSAKDFRTWAGTVSAAYELLTHPPANSPRAAKAIVSQAVVKVAEVLGNTKAVCRKCYIHPAVLNAYLDDTLGKKLRVNSRAGPRTALPSREAAVLRLLEADRGKRGGATTHAKAASHKR